MTVVAKLADLAEGRLTPSSIGRVPILLTLVNNQPVAVAARCPHQGAQLQAGCVTGLVGSGPDGTVTVDPTRPVLRCPWHGFEYDLVSGEPTVPPPAHRRMQLRTYPARIVGEEVVIDQ